MLDDLGQDSRKDGQEAAREQVAHRDDHSAMVPANMPGRARSCNRAPQAQGTVRFGLGAAEYEIDLSAANAARFRAELAPFIDHAPARPAAAGKPGRGGRPRLAGPARVTGLGQGAWHRDQRARPHPGQRHQPV